MHSVSTRTPPPLHTQILIKVAHVANKSSGNTRSPVVSLLGWQVESWYGITQTRQVYEKAIKELDDDGAREVR